MKQIRMTTGCPTFPSLPNAVLVFTRKGLRPRKPQFQAKLCDCPLLQWEREGLRGVSFGWMVAEVLLGDSSLFRAGFVGRIFAFSTAASGVTAGSIESINIHCNANIWGTSLGTLIKLRL